MVASQVGISPAMANPDLEQELDSLYSLPLARFVGARNELAKRLRASGDRTAADEIAGLRKPSVTAWAVNALYHHERRSFDELVAAAAAVRAALAGKGDRRKADRVRRQALQRLLGKAAKMLTTAGHAATPANRQRINHTLEALTAGDPADGGPRPGRLAADLEPQGFDVLAGLAASLAPAEAAARRGSSSRSTGKATAPEEDESLAAARRQVAEHEEALARLERDVAAAEAAVNEVTERHERLAEAAEAAERRARQAAEAAAVAKKEMAATKTAAAKARADRRRGVSRLATARRQLERLGKA
jgi:hypothetical protein